METLELLIQDYLSLVNEISLSIQEDQPEGRLQGFLFETVPDGWIPFGPNNPKYKFFILPSDLTTQIPDKIVRFKKVDNYYQVDFDFKKVSQKGRAKEIEDNLKVFYIPEVTKELDRIS